MKQPYVAPSVSEIGGVVGMTEANNFGPNTDFRGRRGIIQGPTPPRGTS